MTITGPKKEKLQVQSARIRVEWLPDFEYREANFLHIWPLNININISINIIIIIIINININMDIYRDKRRGKADTFRSGNDAAFGAGDGSRAAVGTA